MIKYILSFFIFFITSFTFFISEIQAKDPLFIEQSTYQSWTVTKFYNRVKLSFAQDNVPFTLSFEPYDYSLTIHVKFNHLPSSISNIELDAGEFNTELKPITNQTYTAILEPINTVQFFNELKQQPNINIILNDQTIISVPLKGINDAMKEMEQFAVNHYIILPQPFATKLDEYSTMTIPKIVPTTLYPIFRQQASMAGQCQTSQDQQSPVCNDYRKLILLLRRNNICQKEENFSAQSYGKQDIKSYQWISCNPSP